MEQVKFLPLTPAALALRLARWIDLRGPDRLRVGFDGFPEVGTSELADAVAQHLTALQRPVIRISTQWWWRSAALRLEYGRQDVQSRLEGWVDVGSLRREAFDPLSPSGSGQYLTKLRDPRTDRAVRQEFGSATKNAVLLLDGPLLQTHQLAFDALVQVGVSAGRLQRTMPATRQWELEAAREYREVFLPAHPFGRPSVLISYEHPATPAARGLDLR